jgi:hypothetical protein
LKHASLAIVVSKQFGGENFSTCTIGSRYETETLTYPLIVGTFGPDEESGITGSIEFLEEVGSKLSGDKEAHLLIRFEQQVCRIKRATFVQ